MRQILRHSSGQAFIGAIAKQAGVPIKTIRYYEEVGVLPKSSRTESRYRLYGPEVVDRLQFIKRAQRLGLTLEEIREILELSDRKRCPCGHVEQLLEAKLRGLQEKIKDLRVVEGRIRQLLHAPSQKPIGLPQGAAICQKIEQHQGLNCCPSGPQPIRMVKQRRKGR